MTDAEFHKELLEIAIISDLLEAKIKKVNPDSLKCEIFAYKLRFAFNAIKTLRKHFDRFFKHDAEMAGNYYDLIHSELEISLKQIIEKNVRIN